MDLAARARAFEEAHPGTSRDNWTEVFRDDDQLVEAEEFFEVSDLYERIALLQER